VSDIFPLTLSVTEVNIHSVKGGLEYELVREDGENLVVYGPADPTYDQLMQYGIVEYDEEAGERVVSEDY